MADTAQCAHCGVVFYLDEEQVFSPIFGAEDLEWISTAVCPSCKRTTIETGNAGASLLVYPRAPFRKSIPPEVPPSCAADYREAYLVLGDSQKASAALSRRCLQSFLREVLGVRPANLDREIQQVLESHKLPDQLAKDLDAVRAVGNLAVHPIKSINTGEIIDVEPGDAEWLLSILEALFDWEYVQHPRQQAHHQALNKKLDSAGKPPLKDSVS